MVAEGPEPFIEGPAQVTAEVLIRDQGLVVDVQEWTRRVTIVNAAVLSVLYLSHTNDHAESSPS